MFENMAKSLTKHGLARKFKPWRKGKSVNANKAGSLKSQLRSKKRLLVKITNNDDIRTTLENDIANLEKAIEIRQKQEKEKKYATKYHRIKFVERQKLTRMEKRCKRNLEEAKAAADFDDVEKYTRQLEQICMDQLYVAYFPKEKKYISLFGANGIRMQDDAKTFKKRADIRKTIIGLIQNGQINTNKSWVNMDLLKAKGFHVDMTNMLIDETEADDPTKMSVAVKEASTHASFPKNGIPSNRKSEDSSSSSSDDDDDDDSESNDDNVGNEESDHPYSIENTLNVAALNDANNQPPEKNQNQIYSSDSSSDDSSSSSSTSSSSSSSSSESKSDVEPEPEGKEVVNHGTNNVVSSEPVKDDESDDDFLVDDSGSTDVKEVFAKAQKEKVYYKVKGDKSMGWKTQNQRPGEWKKRR
mmetsp:Transcript_14333/g.26902  ORF Transcript_14333/g.26902 Transcript_14333/m.26902 type:complete len:414 (-) Transcript_14333:1024-2265(-)